jgi:F-type H+-transporting ATPase subunit b
VIPGLSVVWVVIIVLLLALVLDRGLFKPITRVMGEREAAIRSASDLAKEAAAKAAAATAEFERRTGHAQAEIQRAMNEQRRLALEHRRELLAETRRDVEHSLAEATASLQAEVVSARAKLNQDADALADAVVERVLGRRAS